MRSNAGHHSIVTNIYSRLYTYRQNQKREALEDFLTEAFADLFDRLDAPTKRSLLAVLMPSSAVALIEAIVSDLGALNLQTQVVITVEGYSKRPDMVLRWGRRNLLVIEAKVGAGFQSHTFGAPAEADSEPVVRNQLETYAEWIAGQQEDDAAWPGAIVFLTARTDPPEGFRQRRQDGVMTSVVTWKEVGLWLHKTLGAGDRRLAAVALAADLHAFIKENDLMTKYPTSRDLAATMLFAHSYIALEAMIRDTIKVMAKQFPKLSHGRNLNVGFLSGHNLYWGWFLFSKAVRRLPTVPFLAVGICFEVPKAWEGDVDGLPQHEPFFFVVSGDDRYKERIDTIYRGVPKGWTTVEDRWRIISCRPVSAFPADPEKRVADLQTWAAGEVDRLVVQVVDYEKAPAGPIAREKSVDDD